MAWETMAKASPIGAVTPPGLVLAGMEETFVQGWINNTYIAWEFSAGAWGHLSIKRRDRKPIHDWRHLQQIKNDIFGPGREAVELYPARSRVIDSANQYHLWILPKGKAMAIGSWHRVVASEADVALIGAEQRPFEDGLDI